MDGKVCPAWTSLESFMVWKIDASFAGSVQVSKASVAWLCLSGPFVHFKAAAVEVSLQLYIGVTIQ